MTRLVLRLNATFDVVIGVVLAAASWDGLFGIIDVSAPDAAPLAQLAGVLLIAFGYLLWMAPRDARLTRAIAAGRGAANLATAGLIAAWITLGHLGAPAPLDTLLPIVAIVSLCLAVAEGWIATRAMAMLLPRD